MERQEKLTGHREPPKSSLFTLSDSHYLLSFTICESFGYAALKGKKTKKKVQVSLQRQEILGLSFQIGTSSLSKCTKIGLSLYNKLAINFVNFVILEIVPAL